MTTINITNKLYRYESLLQAIDFFTQRFSLEQLSSFAFDFANEILTLNASTIFIREGDYFVQKSYRLYSTKNHLIKNSEKLQMIATFHGNIMTNHFDSFFDKEDVEKFNLKLVIPLILGDILHGFIFSDGKAMMEKFTEDDYIISMTLMRLFNNAMENSKNFAEIQQKNKELDQKIFNLFAINQSSKTLLSQLNLENLYTIATDVFSEVTCSKVTSFGVYDNISNTIKIHGYRNVSTFSKYYTELVMKSSDISTSKVVLSIQEDMDLIKDIFENWNQFEDLEAKYIVLLIKDRILGLVTLGESVNSYEYGKDVFELIEALASFTYIAVSNSLLFEELNIKNEIIEKKFKTLHMLNRLIKNINHCTTVDELIRITLKSIQLSFGVKKAFIAMKDLNGYKISNATGLDLVGLVFQTNDKWEDTNFGETIYDFAANSYTKFFADGLMEKLEDTNCTIISPIINESYIEDELKEPLGYLVVLQTREGLKEEEILLIDTITKNISPIIYQMNIVSYHKDNYIKNTKTTFLEVLDRKIKEKKEYLIDFYLYYKRLEKNPFEDMQIEDLLTEESYVVDNYVFVIDYEPIQCESFVKIHTPNSIEEFLNTKF